jgi:hypothetical protein
MSRTTRMIRTIVPIPMYMTLPLVAVNAGAQIRPANRPSHCPQSARPNQPTRPWLAMTRSEMRGPHDSHQGRSSLCSLESSPLAPLSAGADNEWQHFSCELNPRLSRPVSASARSQCTAARRWLPARRQGSCRADAVTADRRAGSAVEHREKPASCDPRAQPTSSTTPKRTSPTPGTATT